MRLRLNSNDFTKMYSLIDKSFNVESAGFRFLGYGETAPEAYRDATPTLSFLAHHENDPLGATVSYNSGDLVLESVWSEAEDQLRRLYETLMESGARYDGGALIDYEEDDAWMIANYGTVDPSERI